VVLVVMLEPEILEWLVVVGQAVMVEVVEVVLFPSLVAVSGPLVQVVLVELLEVILVVLACKEYQKVALP
jgi:hypothetical protein